MEGFGEFRNYMLLSNPDSDSTDFTKPIFHSKSGDINLTKLTSKKLYWILVEDIRVPPTARLSLQLHIR